MAVTLQARSGVARSGASRSNYFSHANMVMTINGVDRSARVIRESLSVHLAINDDPDSASFRVKPGVFVPMVNQHIVIGLGSIDNREFAGQIVRVAHTRLYAAADPFFDVTCIDWQRLFDRRLICAEYRSVSATTIAQDIVLRWASGFTANNVMPGLPTIAVFTLTNEKPSTAMRRLARLVGGDNYIDAYQDAHLWGTAGASGPLSPTLPTTLTNNLDTLKEFSHAYDGSQQRTRVFVEGRTAQALISVPAGATSFPLSDGQVLSDAGSAAVRLGTQLIGTYSNADFYETATGVNVPGGILKTAVAAGTTSIVVVISSGDTTWTSAVTWAKLGDQVIRVDFASSAPPDYTLTVPASGYGSLQAPVAADMPVTPLSSVGDFSSAVFVAQPKDSTVVRRAPQEDAPAAAALAAIEGGDGYHEYVLSDGRLGYDGAQEVGAAELEAFSVELLSARWTTVDLNARPGRNQAIALTGSDSLSATLVITQTELSFPFINGPPLAVCEGSTVRVSGVLDRLVGDA